MWSSPTVYLAAARLGVCSAASSVRSASALLTRLLASSCIPLLQFDAFSKGTFAIADELATMKDCITIIGEHC